MRLLEFSSVWALVVKNAGKPFHTVTGLPFTYEVRGEAVYTSRTNYRLTKRDFESAFQQMPASGPGQFNTSVHGPSYVFAILSALT